MTSATVRVPEELASVLYRMAADEGLEVHGRPTEHRSGFGGWATTAAEVSGTAILAHLAVTGEWPAIKKVVAAFRKRFPGAPIEVDQPGDDRGYR